MSLLLRIGIVVGLNLLYTASAQFSVALHFVNSPGPFQIGVPTELIWQGGSDNVPFTLTLVETCTDRSCLQVVGPIATNITSTSYSWTPPGTLSTKSNYFIRVSQGNDSPVADTADIPLLPAGAVSSSSSSGSGGAGAGVVASATSAQSTITINTGGFPINPTPSSVSATQSSIQSIGSLAVSSSPASNGNFLSSTSAISSTVPAVSSDNQVLNAVQTTSSAAQTTTATAQSTGSGLSQGSRIGIGVGVGIGAALIMLVTMLLFFRRQRRGFRAAQRRGREPGLRISKYGEPGVAHPDYEREPGVDVGGYGPGTLVK